MQPLCATATLSPKVRFAMAAGFWSEMWEEWFRPLSKDSLKSPSVLAILYVFWEGIVLMRVRGYPSGYLNICEKTHFAFMWASLVVISSNFLIKQVVGLWSKKRKRR